VNPAPAAGLGEVCARGAFVLGPFGCAQGFGEFRVNSVEGAGIYESLVFQRSQFCGFLIKEELLCVVCEAVVEHLVLHSENILHFD
jgi:hypothetical protein